MAYAKDTYTGNGSSQNFTVSFPYLSQTHVQVYVDGVLKAVTTDYTWSNSTTIHFNTAPTTGAVINFIRSSNPSARLVDYQDGSTLTESMMDQDANQLFYLGQEAVDRSNSAVALNMSNEWDAQSHKIINVSDPTLAQDAATKSYVDQLALGTLGSPLSITNGGTGSTTAANARTALGITPANIGAQPAGSYLTAASPTITSGPLTFPDSSSVGTAGSLGIRNILLNGSMRFAQRGTTYTLTTTHDYGSLDRWAGVGLAGSVSTMNQTPTAGGVQGFQQCMKLSRNSGSATIGNIGCAQALESGNSIPLQGKYVTLSFYALKGANFSASGNTLNVVIYTGTGSNESVATIGAWAGNSTNLIPKTITSSWERYNYTVGLSSSVTQIGVQFYYTTTGTAGTDDAVYITGVQLEEGQVATPFQFLPNMVEQDALQRYYQTGDVQTMWNFTGVTTSAASSVTFPTKMRTTPTVTVSTGTLGSSTASGFSVYQSSITSGSPMAASTYTAKAEL